MKRLLLLIFLLGCCLTFCACAEKQEEGSASKTYVYYKDTGDTKLVSKPYELKADTADGRIEELLQALFKSPEDMSVRSACPEEVVLRNYFFGIDAQLVLDFEASYLEMDKIPEILCRAAIVRTLCQLDEVDHVEFYVGGQSLILSGEQPVGQMTASDFIDNTGGYTELTQTSYVTIYFANESGDRLSDIRVKIENDGSKSNEQLVVEQLIAGPDSITGAEDVFPSIPEDTRLNKIITKDGICYVDLSREYLSKRPEITTEVAVYSLVNSLCELSNVSKVVIYVDGAPDKLLDGISLGSMLERKPELISE